MVQALIDKAEVLVEALPYIRRFFDKTIVIKYGGSAMSDEDLRASFAVDVVLLKYIGLRPVIAPIGVDDAGVTHNVNADEAAGAVARALRAEKLILLTDVEGVKDAQGELIHQLSVSEARKHIAEGTIREGMIPKVECCIESLAEGVASTHVVDGRMRHAILLEIFTDGGVGTLIAR